MAISKNQRTMLKKDFDKFFLETPITYNSVRIDFSEGNSKIGFFENLHGDFDLLQSQNKYRFIENNNSVAYRQNNNDVSLSTIIDGDLVTAITIL
jgi:hypothetical protein